MEKDEEYYMVRREKRGEITPFYNLDLMGVESFNFQWNNK